MRERPDMTVKADSFLLSGDHCFFSLQGEGQSFGKPAIFLRLHLCNLHCKWCDTPYTWDRKDKRFWQEPERWSLRKIIKEITKYPCNRIVITGGEPLLHIKAIDNFLDYFGWDSSFKIEIETNGTIMPTEKMIEKKVQFNVSPKLENSGNLEQVRYRPDVLKHFNTLPNTTFKFVVVEPEDLEEIEAIIRECELDKGRIILMPEGITQKDIVKHGRAIAELCKEKGWRLIPRLQILLWGNTRTK